MAKSSIIQIFKLIRFKNLLIVALVQYLMRWCIIYPILHLKGLELQYSEFNFFLLVFSTLCITAGGYVINDYFDLRTDALNKPDELVVGTSIKRRTAMALHTVLNIAGVLMGIYLSWRMGILKFGIVFVLITGLLWFYSTSFKRKFLAGNLIIALLTALVPLIVLLFEIPALKSAYGQELIFYESDIKNLWFMIAGFTFFAFLITFIREIIKDTEDIEGDIQDNRNTMPVIIGIKATTIISIIFCIGMIASIIYVYFAYLKNLWYLLDDYFTPVYLLVLVILPLVFLIYKLIRAKDKKDFHFASSLLKFIIVTGVLYAVVFWYVANIQNF